MRIAAAVLHRIQIPFGRVFAHALSQRSRTDAVLVQLTDEDGATGWGEVLPRAYVTGETIDSVLGGEAARVVAPLLQRDLVDRPAVLAALDDALSAAGRALATMTGVELALLDLAGKRFGFSAASCLGEHRGPELPAGVIIGFEHATAKLARYCAVLRLSGKRHVKVKVGADDDVERCRIVADVFKNVPLRIDANAAWSVDEAVERLAAIGKVAPIHSIEQPVAADDIAGLAEVRRRSGVPVMADESVCSLADADALIAAGAADIFNIRVGKHGGLLASRRLCQRALEADVRIHLGTLVGETGILSRASEVLGRCQPGLDCLDGKGQNAWLLEQDVLQPSTPGQGRDAPSIESPGLGVEVDEERVASFRVDPPLAVR